MLRIFLVLCFFTICFSSYSQQPSADDYFKAARDAAFKGNDYQQAISLSHKSLALDPENTELRLFLANIFAWSSFPDSARSTLIQITSYSPLDPKALQALAELEYKQKQYKKSLEYCEAGIAAHPMMPEFLVQKAKTFMAMQQYNESLNLCREILKADPANRDALALYRSIKVSKAKNALSIRYDYTWFDKQFDDPWTSASVQYSRQTKAGSVIGRVNFGSRYGQRGTQVEVDAYPRISKRFYTYISGGYSPDEPVFPKYRGGFSLYANLPRAFEAEAGVRYLNFGNDSWIYTVSAGKYISNFWFNLRAYLTPDQSQISHSYSAIARYYLKDADSYLMFSAGTGISPDDRIANAQLNGEYRLSSKGFSAGYHCSISKLNIVSFDLSYSNIEYRPKTKGSQVSGGLGFKRRF